MAEPREPNRSENRHALYFHHIAMALDFETHLKRGHPITFAVLMFFSLIELIQTGASCAHSERG